MSHPEPETGDRHEFVEREQSQVPLTTPHQVSSSQGDEVTKTQEHTHIELIADTPPARITAGTTT
jgi:hypothetical protein